MKTYSIAFLAGLSMIQFSYTTQAKAEPKTYIGDWENKKCRWWNDSTVVGTYDFLFQENGTLRTYLQYFEGHECKIKSPYQGQLASGKYTLKNITPTPGHSTEVTYDISVKF